MKLSNIYLAQAIKIGDVTNNWFSASNGYDLTRYENGDVLIVDKFKCKHCYTTRDNTKSFQDENWGIEKNDTKQRRGSSGNTIIRTKDVKDSQPVKASVQEPS